MFGWIPLLSTLAQAAPVTALDTDKPIVTVIPSFIPAGAGLRYHIPFGAASTLFVGFGVADQVFNIDNTNIRLQTEIGADFYLGERYRALFVAPRVALAYWSSSVIVGESTFGSETGGTNVKGGVMFGGRAPVGSGGGTIGLAAGVLLHTYVQYHATGTSDGIQPLPQVDVDLSLPNSRRSRDHSQGTSRD